MHSIAGKYSGQHLDKFVMDHGAPYSAYKMDNGSTIYQWSSGIDSVSIPQTVSHSGYVSPYGTISGTSTVHGGGSMRLECALKIVTDKRKVISQINIVKDTIGRWETSRCHEIFGS